MKPLLLLVTIISFLACQPKVQQMPATARNVSQLGVPAPETATPGVPYTDLDPGDFAAMIGQPDVVLLDVRTPEETALGKIDGAMEINVLEENFTDKVQNLDKSKTYLVYCRSGRRSAKACQLMADAGFGKLYNLQGGYNAWSAQGQ